MEDSSFRNFGFDDTAEPGVVDKLDSILNELGIGVRGNFEQQVFVDLYFSRGKRHG